jgi:hypothetical protein
MKFFKLENIISFFSRNKVGMLIFIVYVLFMFIMILCTSKNEKNDDQFTEIATGRYLKKIEFEGHTYIYLRNTWNSAGDNLLHDPNCQCQPIVNKKE